MKIFRLLLFFVLGTSLFAQEIGSWKNYTCMKNTQAVQSVSNGIWAITDGGLFLYDSNNNSYLKITKSDGLSSHNLTALAVDNYGKIWIGTLEGVINVYDPANGKVKRLLEIYNSNKNQKRINDLEVRGDTIYVASDFGVSLIHSATLNFLDTVVKFGSFSAETKVNSVFVGSLIYICTEAGLAIQKSGVQSLTDPETWNVYPLGVDIIAESILSATEFNNQVMVGTDKGIYRISGSVIEKMWFDVSIIDFKVFGSNLYCIVSNKDNSGKVSSSSAYKFAGEVFEEIYTESGSAFNKIDFSNDGIMIIATSSGLTYFPSGSSTKLIPDGPASNLFNSVTVDINENLWAGSGRDVTGYGFYKFDGEKWTNYNMATLDVIKSNAYHIASAQENGDVFFCNWGGGVTRFRNNEFITFNSENTDLPGIADYPTFIVISGAMNDSKNNSWFLNFVPDDRKVLSVNTSDNQWYHYTFTSPNIPIGNTSQHLVIDQYDTKWFAVTNGNLGLYYFNEQGTFESSSDDFKGWITIENGLRNNNITSLAVDLRGEIWVGTSLGISIIPNSNPDNPKYNILSAEAFAIKQQSITSIAVDAINRKWIGSKEGLFLLSADGSRVLENFTTSNSPLPANDIKSIAIDNIKGIVYVGTDYGLTSFQTVAVEPLDSFSELFIYPNPVHLSNGQDANIKIDGLIKNTSIKILSISGKLISEFDSPGGKIAFWNGRDLDGKTVPSGIYIIVAYDQEANNVAHGKIAVIRE
ncbi:MAG: two-component regulator propeller domain-containing protein [bacterium]